MSETQSQPAQTGARPGGPPPVELPDIREYGAVRDGARQVTDRRLFMQLHVFTECLDPGPLAHALEHSKLETVLYLDVNDPRGAGVLLVSEDPAVFAGQGRQLLLTEPFAALRPRPEFTMIGRTYSVGHEQDLEDWLLKKPRRNLANTALDWAVWYPLRRKGEFELVDKDEQRKIMFEHARLGMGYGQADLAHDVRLACHGLDRDDNEFVLGIVAHDLYPISRLVQDMRRTQQTSKYIQKMGPFFVGKALYRSVRS